MKPKGKGTAKKFEATINAEAGWEPYYHKWSRTWLSSSPAHLTIKDEYELKQGKGVEFFWNTRLPVTIEAEVVTIVGSRGHLQIDIPHGCEFALDELPMFSGPVQKRISFRKKGQKGTVEVKVRLMKV